MADKYNMPFIETSAKEGTNVNKVFEELGRAIITDFNKLANEELAGYKLSGGLNVANQSGCGC
jgi:GTPase SAR1 family protein